MLLSFEVRILRAPWLCSPASHVSLGVFVRRVVSAAVQAVRSPWEFPLMLTEFRRFGTPTRCAKNSPLCRFSLLLRHYVRISTRYDLDVEALRQRVLYV